MLVKLQIFKGFIRNEALVLVGATWRIAALRKQSRMIFINATNLHKKAGEA